MDNEYYVYMVICSDDTIYTGWTNDPESRIAVHNSGSGAKYTRSRRPVRLAYIEKYDTKQAAMKKEHEIKKLDRKRKLELIEQRNEIIYDRMICNMTKEYDIKPAIIVPSGADGLTRFAAEELAGYIKKLFDLDPCISDVIYKTKAPTFYLGPRSENPYFQIGKMPDKLEKAHEQAVMIYRVSENSTVISGGSKTAALWAVYRLAEQWGIEFLLHEDIFPDKQSFYMPDTDVFEEPIEPIRTWSFPHGLAFGPESWGSSDYIDIISQLSKMRFNRIMLQYYPGYPLIDFEYNGIRRSTVSLFFNYHYPITDDMIGRELFDDRREFWNKDLPITNNSTDMINAGKKLVHSIISHAHSRGMECIMGVLPLEYLKEFAPAIKDPLIIKLLDTETVVPGKGVGVEDEDLFNMALATVRETIKEYPEIDMIAPVMPEFRDWVDHSENAWTALDRKYGISAILKYSEVIDKAALRTEYPGGSERAVKEVKGDIVALYFYDLFFYGRKALSHTCRPDIKLMYMNLSEELYPLLSLIIPKDVEVSCYIDYTPTRVLKRREALRGIKQDIDFTLYYTLQDDNIGFLPMVAAESLDELLKTARSAGWKGFMSRYWLTSDHDICVNHLARAMWNGKLRCFDTYMRMLPSLCGSECVYELLGMFRELENATIILEKDALGFAFPIPNMVSSHWDRTEPSFGMTEALYDYERAFDWANRARLRSAGKGSWYIDYWIDRIAFGIGYIQMTEAVFKGSLSAAAGDMRKAEEYVSQALSLASEACGNYAKAARDCSDIASIAVFNEYGIRYLRQKLKEIAGDKKL